ncbi:hypothetical protein ACHAXA_003961, partial [Cyclostephanos tholiformis]
KQKGQPATGENSICNITNFNPHINLIIAMPISDKAQRAWKTGTAVLTAWTAFYGLFYIDYGSHDHCFTDIQRWYRGKLDGLLGIDARALKKSSHVHKNNTDDDGIPKKDGISKGSISR